MNFYNNIRGKYQFYRKEKKFSYIYLARLLVINVIYLNINYAAVFVESNNINNFV